VNFSGAGTEVNALTLTTGQFGSGVVNVSSIVGGNLSTTALSMAAGTQLDLRQGTLLVDYTAGNSPIATIGALITSGYNNGTWTGTGIRSSNAAVLPASRAVGFAEATDLFTTFPAVFSGTTVDNTTVLARYTIAADATLDRIVNLSDFNKLASNFGGTNRRWSQGNFNFDTVVNLTDFNRLASTFGTSISGPDLFRGSLNEWIADASDAIAD